MEDPVVCGLNAYEVRRYVSWCRHITLGMTALAVLTPIAGQLQGNSRATAVLSRCVPADAGRSTSLSPSERCGPGEPSLEGI